jgi:DNA-directed RNA polymerase specialized sigma24 family protein
MTEARDPASASELTDGQLDALLDSADQELERHIQDHTDLGATLTRLLASRANAATGGEAPASDAAKNTGQGYGPTRVDQLLAAIDAPIMSSAGYPDAFAGLVGHYSPLVRSICAGYRLTPQDVDQVSRTVWLRLAEHIGTIRIPAALPGWLAVTTSRECRRGVREAGRHDHAESDADVLRAELDRALVDGLAELPGMCQALLWLLAAEPPESYWEISQLTGIPIANIGPQRRRCLNRLRHTDAISAYLAGGSGGAAEIAAALRGGGDPPDPYTVTEEENGERDAAPQASFGNLPALWQQLLSTAARELPPSISDPRREQCSKSSPKGQ